MGAGSPAPARPRSIPLPPRTRDRPFRRPATERKRRATATLRIRHRQHNPASLCAWEGVKWRRTAMQHCPSPGVTGLHPFQKARPLRERSNRRSRHVPVAMIHATPPDQAGNGPTPPDRIRQATTAQCRSQGAMQRSCGVTTTQTTACPFGQREKIIRAAHAFAVQFNHVSRAGRLEPVLPPVPLLARHAEQLTRRRLRQIEGCSPRF